MRYDGFIRREDRAWLMVGTLGVWLLSPHVKSQARHNLKPEKLVGRKLRLFPKVPD